MTGENGITGSGVKTRLLVSSLACNRNFRLKKEMLETKDQVMRIAWCPCFIFVTWCPCFQVFQWLRGLGNELCARMVLDTEQHKRTPTQVVLGLTKFVLDCKKSSSKSATVDFLCMEKKFNGSKTDYLHQILQTLAQVKLQPCFTRTPAIYNSLAEMVRCG